MGMLRIDNLRIATKIGLIVAMFAVVASGAIGFAALRMQSVDDAYSELIDNVGYANFMAARGNVFAESYVSNIYQLVAETTDEGNARPAILNADESQSHLPPDDRRRVDRVRSATVGRQSSRSHR